MKASHEVAVLNSLLMHALSACVHYQEYIDTKLQEPVDLMSAQTALSGNMALADWVRKNAVLLPVRRDGLKFLDVFRATNTITSIGV